MKVEPLQRITCKSLAFIIIFGSFLSHTIKNKKKTCCVCRSSFNSVSPRPENLQLRLMCKWKGNYESEVIGVGRKLLGTRCTAVDVL